MPEMLRGPALATASGRRGTSSLADCSLDACRLHPWRDEHRQHCAFRERPLILDRAPFIDSCGPATGTPSARSMNLGVTPMVINRPLRNGILPGSPRPPLPLLWIPTPSGRSSLQTRRSPRLRRAFSRSIGLPALRDKLGYSSDEEGDLELAHAFLRAMHENAADFTLKLSRSLCDLPRMRKLTLTCGSWASRTPQPTTVGSRGGDPVWSLRSSSPTHALRR